MDALFPQVFGDMKRLLENGVKVYVLMRTSVVERIREENGLRKSGENDAVVLSKVTLNEFKELTLDRLLLEEDIARYRRLTVILKALRRWRADGDLDNEIGKYVIN